MSHDIHQIEEARHAAKAGVPLSRALAAVFVLYSAATLLSVDGTLHLNLPRKWLEQFNPEDL